MSRRPKKTEKMNVSDHADVVLKKSDEKILSGDKVMLLWKSDFFKQKSARRLLKRGMKLAKNVFYTFVVHYKSRWGTPKCLGYPRKP